MKGAAVVSIACDSIEWGEVRTPASGGSSQTATVYVNGQAVLMLSVMWPDAQPSHPVACAFMPRQAGPTD